jgi:hypothetical protein
MLAAPTLAQVDAVHSLSILCISMISGECHAGPVGFLWFLPLGHYPEDYTPSLRIFQVLVP